MKRNTFFARFLVSEEDIIENGKRPSRSAVRDIGKKYFIVEQYFTTNELYIIEPPSIRPLNSVETELSTYSCVGDSSVIETSNGLLFSRIPNLAPGQQEIYYTVAFDVIEDGSTFLTLDNVRAVSISDDGLVIDNGQYYVAAYAIGTIDGQGSINSGALNQDNTVWISGAHRTVRDVTPYGSVISNKFVNKAAFTHPAYISDPARQMEDYQFIEVYRERSSGTDDCCVSQIHSNAINAAAILVASNNVTTPALIKKIEDAVSNNFNLSSTLSALQSMRQLGTLSNMTSKVLDNVVRKDIDVDLNIIDVEFNIKNGKEVE